MVWVNVSLIEGLKCFQLQFYSNQVQRNKYYKQINSPLALRHDHSHTYIHIFMNKKIYLYVDCFHMINWASFN